MLWCDPLPCCVLLVQVAVYCTLLPLREQGTVLPTGVAAFMDRLAADAAVKAGADMVSCSNKGSSSMGSSS